MFTADYKNINSFGVSYDVFLFLQGPEYQNASIGWGDLFYLQPCMKLGIQVKIVQLLDLNLDNLIAVFTLLFLYKIYFSVTFCYSFFNVHFSFLYETSLFR